MSTIIRAKAPLRISFCGGGTDIKSFYEKEGYGVVLSATIAKYSYVTLIPNKDQEIRMRSLDFEGETVKYTVEDTPVFDGTLDLAKAAIRKFHVKEGFDLYLHSEVPPGSGLGTSSTFTVSVVGAMNTFLRLDMDRYAVSQLSYDIERTDANILGGKQDQYAATFGGFNFIEFYPEKTVVNQLRIPLSILNELECHLLMCYTGRTRYSSHLIDKQVKLYEENRMETVEGLRQLCELTVVMKDALMHGDLRKFGKILHESGEIKKRINPETVDKHIEDLYETARQNGAVGGKILGAGGGGFLLLFVPVDQKSKVVKALEALGGQCMPFTFEHDGLQTWTSKCP